MLQKKFNDWQQMVNRIQTLFAKWTFSKASGTVTITRDREKIDQQLTGESSVTIPESTAGRVSAPVSFAFLKWRTGKVKESCLAPPPSLLPPSGGSRGGAGGSGSPPLIFRENRSPKGRKNCFWNTKTFFFFSWTLIQSFRVQLQKKLLTFYELNEME